MPFADGDTTKTQIHETLKLLHETIQKQTKATEEQSGVMIRLTRFLLSFTIVLCVLGFIQIAAMFIQYHDTLPRTVQKQNFHQQMPEEIKPGKVIPTLPSIIKGEKEGHK